MMTQAPYSPFHRLQQGKRQTNYSTTMIPN